MSNQSTSITSLDTEDRDEADMVVMVLYWKANSLGCVYYLHQFRELYFLVDTTNVDLNYILTGLLDQIQPSRVILCKQNDPELTAIIQKHNQLIKIELQESKTFNYQQGQQEMTHWYSQHSTIMNEPLSPSPIMASSTSLSGTTSQFQSLPTVSDVDLVKQIYFQLSCAIPMDSVLTISCVSPLFDALKSVGNQFETENTEGMVPMTLQTISLPNTLYLPSDVLRSLEIFATNAHPSTYQKKGRESTSLFNLLNRTVTPAGTHLLKQWILRPVLNLGLIKERQQSVEYIMQMEKANTGGKKYIKAVNSHLKHVKNMSRILGRIYGHHASISEWHQLLKFIYHVIQLMDMLNQLPSTNAPIIQKLLSAMDPELLISLGQRINDMISFENSHVEGRLTVKAGVNDELDLLRSNYEALDEYLLQVAHELSSTLPARISHLLNVVYFPQLGYLLTLPSNTHEYFIQHSLSLGCDLQFTTNERCYYKDDRTRDMDEEIGDVHGMIVDKQIELIQELSGNILQHQEHILQIAGILAEFDCLISFSITALQNKYVKPHLTDTKELTIVQGRHPLQEHVMDTFIPNDTFLGGDGVSDRHQPTPFSSPSSSSTTGTATAGTTTAGMATRGATKGGTTTAGTTTTGTTTAGTTGVAGGSASCTQLPYSQQTVEEQRRNYILLLTGANFSGKSVYLKQIGLIVYMAHIGSFVPAERAVIGLVDKIFTSIQTTECVSTAHSAFAYDLMQISQAMRYSTGKSLVIIDEFGKGTNTVDGASLFAAVLNEFIKRGTECPKVIATTHFHELMTYNLLPQDRSISYYTTEIMYRVMTDDGLDSLTTTSVDNDHAKQEQVVFLYRVIPGIGMGESFGRWCASLGGIPASVLQRSRVLHQQISLGEPYEIPWTQKDQTLFDTLEPLLTQFLAIRDFDAEATQIQTIMDRINTLFLLDKKSSSQ